MPSSGMLLLNSKPVNIIYKIWGFRSGDYEECRLLGYKNPVRTWQKTHYVPTTEPSRLMLCKIWVCHGSDYEECRLLGCSAVWAILHSHRRENIIHYILILVLCIRHQITLHVFSFSETMFILSMLKILPFHRLYSWGWWNTYLHYFRVTLYEI
jgi:hypothetical protein